MMLMVRRAASWLRNKTRARMCLPGTDSLLLLSEVLLPWMPTIHHHLFKFIKLHPFFLSSQNLKNKVILFNC